MPHAHEPYVPFDAFILDRHIHPAGALVVQRLMRLGTLRRDFAPNGQVVPLSYPLKTSNKGAGIGDSSRPGPWCARITVHGLEGTHRTVNGYCAQRQAKAHSMTARNHISKT